MEKRIIASMIILFIAPALWAQVDKTQLSLDIKAKYMQNYALLANYTWQRQAQVFMKGELKVSMLSAVSIGPDGKPVSQIIDKVSTTEKKPGIRGAIQKSESEDMKEYVQSALELVNKYVFLTKGEMVDLFDKGTISLINNTLQAQAFNFIVQGDNLNFLYDEKTLVCINQTVNTVMNGDPVKAQVVYKLLNGVNVVDNITLTLPAKGLTVTAKNSQFAKKL